MNRGLLKVTVYHLANGKLKIMEIWERVMKMYPITKREKCCSVFRKKMEYKREQLKKRYECERQEKIQREYSRVNGKSLKALP